MRGASVSGRLRFFSSVLQFGNGCEKGRSPPFEAVCDRTEANSCFPQQIIRASAVIPIPVHRAFVFLRVRHSFAGQNSQSRGVPPP